MSASAGWSAVMMRDASLSACCKTAGSGRTDHRGARQKDDDQDPDHRHNQQVVRFDRETNDGIERDAHRSLFATVTERVREGLDAIILSDYCKGVVTRALVRDIVKLAKRHGSSCRSIPR